MIIQSGITEVVYLGDKYHDSNMSIASRRMFDMAGVKYTKYSGKVEDIVIKMNDLFFVFFYYMKYSGDDLTIGFSIYIIRK